MSWDSGPTEPWKGDGEDGGFQVNAGFEPDNAGFDTGNAGELGGGDVGGGDNGGDDDPTCRVCNQPRHLARECPDKKPMECFNCGQVGHSKVECTNERVERPFRGTCNHCGQEGHRAADCPDKPADKCRLCDKEGHKALECTAKRTDMFKDAHVMTDEEAWKAMKAAGKDLYLFRLALQSYCRFMFAMTVEDEDVPPVKANELETAFRKAGFNVHLIAKENDCGPEYTMVSLGGEINQKYMLTLQTSDRPKRLAQAGGWPKDADENLKRLESAGFKLDSGVPVCENCGKKGHIRKSCPEEKVESAFEQPKIKCVLCGDEGHRPRNCNNRPQDLCRRCKKPGHMAADCTEPRDASDVECKACGEMGRFSRDCPTKPAQAPRTCRNCGEEGHTGRDCTNEANPALMICRNCDETGHMSRECPKPTDWSRVRCRECGEMGHTVERCPQVGAAHSGYGGFNDDSFGAADAPTETVASGGWGNGDAGGVAVAASRGR